MKYFKNKDLSSLYNVSDKTVRNWIEAAQQKKLPLELHEDRGRFYIQASNHNHAVLDDIALAGRKYRNRRSHRVVKPLPEFYQLFDRRQVDEIINELDKRHLLPVKYKYFGEGATYWDQYLKELYSDPKGNLITNTIEALDLDLAYLDSQTRPYKHINVINLCVGNSLAIRGVLEHFKAQGKLRRLVMIDLSKDMLNTSEKNVKEWFGDQLLVEKYTQDLSFERFGHILTMDSFGSDASETINLIFLVAGPIVNFYDPQDILRIAYASMGKNDLMITTLKRDTERTRKFFNFNIKGFSGVLNPHDRLLLKLLQIDESFYTLKQVLSEKKRIRGIQITLNRNLSVHFEMDGFSKMVDLEKGQVLPIWWSRLHSDEEIIRRFTTADFEVLRMTKSQDDQVIMLVARAGQTTNAESFLSP